MLVSSSLLFTSSFSLVIVCLFGLYLYFLYEQSVDEIVGTRSVPQNRFTEIDGEVDLAKLQRICKLLQDEISIHLEPSLLNLSLEKKTQVEKNVLKQTELESLRKELSELLDETRRLEKDL